MATTIKNPYGEFWALLKKIPKATKESIVMQYSGQTHLHVLYESDRITYNRMIDDMKSIVYKSHEAKIDKQRKRAFAAVAAWFDADRAYTDVSRGERIVRIRQTIIRASGKGNVDINDLTISELNRIIYEFNKKTDTKRRADIEKQDIRRAGKRGYPFPEMNYSLLN